MYNISKPLEMGYSLVKSALGSPNKTLKILILLGGISAAVACGSGQDIQNQTSEPEAATPRHSLELMIYINPAGLTSENQICEGITVSNYKKILGREAPEDTQFRTGGYGYGRAEVGFTGIGSYITHIESPDGIEKEYKVETNYRDSMSPSDFPKEFSDNVAHLDANKILKKIQEACDSD